MNKNTATILVHNKAMKYIENILLKERLTLCQAFLNPRVRETLSKILIRKAIKLMKKRFSEIYKISQLRLNESVLIFLHI